jgi:general secretion pathway protein G
MGGKGRKGGTGRLGKTHKTPSAGARGYSFIELLVVATIIMILASAIMPLAKVTARRQREVELHRVLREMRTAIDKYKESVDTGLIGSIDVKAGSEGYPPDLDTLVEGVGVANDASGRKLKFLRRVPRDPTTNSTDWGKRSYSDKPDATTWGGSNVYDVYCKSTAKALDGTKYIDW